jgi:hypothetical protein
MSRDEQIKDFAKQRFGNVGGRESQYMLAKIQACMVGARWADNNPRRLYIVMRCEEHSDYVEKVFVDKDKAIAYCENYNSNPREYSRTIEEMEVTL